jgi:hypothetical protein
MVGPVKVELSQNAVEEMSDSEKLNALVHIAFANHEQLSKQGLILFGNGDPQKGLCSIVDKQRTRLNWLIGILSGLGSAGIAILTAVITK